ncbi:hypothetical protein L2Y94_05635 [Luteibacter aegosomatis]|uniref:hypothetical protein n=1 Tax=Luteibacter aegosomatis TaxID=2911537 RepID=UPI001FF9FCBC|nr:hypothetical protein [Luteibacter aegosomatis]UPG86836.1 hypothetical protein L2Y94_05635 [Luteibacter aegosomatis]
MKNKRPLHERARDQIVGLSVLVRRAPTIHRMGEQELEAFADLVKAGASDLNAAHHSLIRLIRQHKKNGAAGATNDTQN